MLSVATVVYDFGYIRVPKPLGNVRNVDCVTPVTLRLVAFFKNVVKLAEPRPLVKR